jgi:hypothetical protein
MKLRIGLILLTFIAIILVMLLAVPPSIEIRIDCGDLRYKYFGIPIFVERMPDQYRVTLIATAGNASVSPAWVKVLPKQTSNDNAHEYVDRYVAISIWAQADKNIGTLLLQDVSSGIKLANGKYYAPSYGMPLLRPAYVALAVPDNWLYDQNVIEFCERGGYMRPEWVKTTQK